MNPLKLFSAKSGPGVAPVDAHAWYDQFERLSYDFVHAIARANLTSVDAARSTANRSHDALLMHAQQLLGSARPIVMAKDGEHIIQYKQLADARAKVRYLQEEIDLLRQGLNVHPSAKG